ncbi:MAG TPA: arginine--tRNA ligase, partial [Terriglobales bacterium]|nr:arginine--tRNA ligase [Terriglobales bacterium]
TASYEAFHREQASVYRLLQRRLITHIRTFLREKYQVELANIVVEQPPKVEMGEYALPFSFELAKKLRKAPRKIAEEIVASIPPLEGFQPFEVAGAGYINAKVDRATLAAELVSGREHQVPFEHPGKILVEHTSINPNKAAHIGHLRNSILGDTFVLLLRAAGREVDVQNYIDNTGVQVADVVVGFVHIEKKSKHEIVELIASDPRFDFYCWDLYARVSQWYKEDKANEQTRGEALHAIEKGGNDYAEIAELISTAVLRRHLETMDRLNIEYDFLPRESEILHLQFWAKAFEQLKAKGVLYYEEEGKNKGCWVMTRAGREKSTEGPDEEAKVIVRSNGTVGYVGKDIAYHMWKFGVLGMDFGYRRFYEYPNHKQAWISTDPDRSEPDHPHFGSVAEIYNVIDARQSDPQETVKEAIRLLGYEDQAAHYTHFSYEMVALTPRCAMELGYEVSAEDQGRAYIEVSGRKGFGVKADDLIDKLIEKAIAEVDSRHPELPEAERRNIAKQIAMGALRYFMLKFTRPTVIAFDFKDALSFEGETGPYAQYAIVRASNIFRKGNTTPEEVLSHPVDFTRFFEDETGTEIWQLWLLASQTSHVIDQCIAQAEPAYLAKHVFQMAQQFNNFYHRHHILHEPDDARKYFLMATAAVVRRELIRVLAVIGVEVPPVM